MRFVAIVHGLMDELAVAKIRRFCEERIPAHLREQVRLEVAVRGNAITIVERRPLWRGPPDAEWTKMKIAQLRFDPEGRRWRLYWPDRNERWHELSDVEPSTSIEPLISELEEDPTAIFWG